MRDAKKVSLRLHGLFSFSSSSFYVRERSNVFVDVYI